MGKGGGFGRGGAVSMLMLSGGVAIDSTRLVSGVFSFGLVCTKNILVFNDLNSLITFLALTVVHPGPFHRRQRNPARQATRKARVRELQTPHVARRPQVHGVQGECAPELQSMEELPHVKGAGVDHG